MLLELGKVAEEKNQITVLYTSNKQKIKLKRDTIGNSVKTVKNQEITLSKIMLRPHSALFSSTRIPVFFCLDVFTII